MVCFKSAMFGRRKVRAGFALLLVVAFWVLIGIPVLAVTPGHLSPEEMSQEIGGESIWDDPCTIDGAMVGGGIVLKNTFLIAMGLIQALYRDNCFD
ncbi:MAG: hypothetical protein P8020_14660 [Acidobacteriota bacterium]|jgi:hypothetical protein